MKYCLITLFAFLFGAAQAQKEFKDNNFSELLKECTAKFRMPRGFYEIPVIPDHGHFYHYAIRDSATGFEARYYLRPYKAFYEGAPVPDDPLTYSFFTASVLNASGYVLPNIPDIIAFENPESLKKEFGADKGWFSSFKPTSEFGRGFAYCTSVIMRKDGVGEYTIFQFFNTINRETEVISQDVLVSIKFE
jgi:hypothetical protein